MKPPRRTMEIEVGNFRAIRLHIDGPYYHIKRACMYKGDCDMVGSKSLWRYKEDGQLRPERFPTLRAAVKAWWDEHGKRHL